MHEVFKLTLVTVRCGAHVHTSLQNLAQLPKGGAVLPQDRLNAILSKMGVQRGQTYTVS